MSYSDNQDNLITIIENLGYRKLPNLSRIDESIRSHGEKGYTVEPTGSSDEENTTSSNYVTTDEILVEVAYKNVDDDERKNNYDDFIALELAIQNDGLFKGWTAKREFGRMNNFNFHSKGTLRFNWGVRTCG